MELINNLRSQSDLLIIFSLSLGLSVAVVILLMYIFHLKSRLNTFEKPKYGFLGKSIYPMIGFIGMGMVVVTAIFGVASPEVEDTQAEMQVEGKISAKVLSQTLNTVNVQFEFEPRVSGQPWGDINDTFDIYWNIKGPSRITKSESQKSKFYPSGFTAELTKGGYTIEITLVYQNETFKFEDTIYY